MMTMKQQTLFDADKPQHEFRNALLDARTWLFDNVDDGVRCPCCDQYARAYRRKLNSSMAAFLILLIREGVGGRDGFRILLEDVCLGLPDEWVDIKETKVWDVSRADYGKLAHWGLIEHKPHEPDENKYSGMWRPTRKGVQFACSRLKVPSHVVLYDNELRSFSGELVGIVECLGKHFSYKELMGEKLTTEEKKGLTDAV